MIATLPKTYYNKNHEKQHSKEKLMKKIKKLTSLLFAVCFYICWHFQDRYRQPLSPLLRKITLVLN